MNLVEVDVSSYDSGGIPLPPQQMGLGVVELVMGTVHGQLGNGSAPLQIVYDPTNSRCLCYTSVDTQVPDLVNIYSNNGPIMLLVIGA